MNSIVKNTQVVTTSTTTVELSAEAQVALKQFADAKEAIKAFEAQKDQADTQLAAARLTLDAQKAQATSTPEAARIAAMTDQANASQDLAEAKAIMDLTKQDKRE